MSNTFLTNLKEYKKKKKIIKIINNESFTGHFKGMCLKPKSYITKEKIELWNKKNNQTPIFKNNYPLLSLISKSSVLNKSPVLLPDILVDNTNKILKCDDKMIKSVENNKNDLECFKMYKSLPLFKTKIKKRAISIKNIKDHFPKYFLNDNAKNYKINKYIKIHDSNFFNRKYFITNPLNSYEENSYKIKSIFKRDEFINKIKFDVSSLKFNSSLKANTDYF